MASKKSRNDIVEEVNTVEEVKTVEEVVEVKDVVKPIAIGDFVKIKPDVSNDMLGKHIHNGIKNYNYKVKLVRVDGYLVIECLAYSFVLKPEEVIKIM